MTDVRLQKSRISFLVEKMLNKSPTKIHTL